MGDTVAPGRIAYARHFSVVPRAPCGETATVRVHSPGHRLDHRTDTWKGRSMVAARTGYRPLAVACLFLSLAAAPRALAAPMDVLLSFSTLPSAQGWTYTASGSHAGAAEAAIFSVDGTRLIQDSMGESNGVSGGSILYARANGITTTETKRIVVRGRCLAQEGSASATLGQGGLYYGFTTGSVQYGFGFTTSRLFVLQPSGTVVLPGTYDNTQFHDYAFLWSPGGTWSLTRDGAPAGSGSGGFAVTANRIFLGDGTGGANAQAETSYFRFTQDLPTPAVATTWGRVKAMFR
jgi:hypothetical protein